MNNLIENITSFVMDPQLGGWLLVSNIGFIVFSLILFAGIIFCLIKSDWLQYLFLQDTAEFLTYRPFGVKKIVKKWNVIMVRLDTGLESEYKLALIEADTMMYDSLKRMRYAGDTLGERLKKLTVATLPNIEDIKRAHQVRNTVMHDPNYTLSLDEIRELLAIFEQAFRDLQAF